jgi:hypothetical protein
MRIFLLTLLLGCNSSPIVADGQPPASVPPGCAALPDRGSFDFLGGACVASAFPANTFCPDNDRGWCIGPELGGPGVCRPMPYDARGCPICPAGTLHYAPAGAAFCEP